MRLTPRELDKAALHSIGFMAQKRLAAGIRLNAPEATALLATQVMHFARIGYSVARLMDIGRTFLGTRQVIPGVGDLLDEVQIEATFPDGTKLVTLHNPISISDGNLVLALTGSFLPEPKVELFSDHPEEGLVPGKVYIAPTPIKINVGRDYVDIMVVNTADRPIQVGSHYHFLEANPYLRFDRRIAYGMRLNVAAGTAVRFEPGEGKTVSLVSIGGNQIVRGGNNLSSGPTDRSNLDLLDSIIQRTVANGFLHEESGSGDGAKKRQKLADGTGSSSQHEPDLLQHNYTGLELDRDLYCRMYGPTTGDVIRLADTELYIRVERDFTVPGDECKFGGGKVLREGMGQATGLPTSQQLDTVITNALVVDVEAGIFKADVGLKDGRIVGIGKAGNPDVMDGVTPGMICGVNTEAIAGEGLILTAGGMDSHVHFICPQICDEALASGLTTMLGGGTGPASGSCATTCTPGPAHMQMMLQATDNIPMNIAFTGKGNTSAPEGLIEIVAAGAVGLKLHEDWGTTPAAIDNCLGVADAEDVQVTIHTDTLNESSCVEQTVAAFKGRTIHTYHTEGAGGGHAPDIISVAGHANVIPSSTNPTRPLTVNTIDEHVDMLMVCHHLDNDIPEDVAFAESRIRQETVAAEDILHDMGVISIVSSDSQAMGRVGEVITRTWQTADKMKRQRGQLVQDVEADKAYAERTTAAAAAAAGGSGGSSSKSSSSSSSSSSSGGSGGASQLLTEHAACKTDNYRVRRYLAKYTSNPCIAHGIFNEIGSIAVGKLADLVLWKPAYFGAKPEMVIKGGYICWAQMGDPNASIPTPQPVQGRMMFAGRGVAASQSSIAFVSKRCVDSGVAKGYNLKKKTMAVRGTRNIGKSSMLLNDNCPKITVDPETYTVTADGVHLTCAPADSVPLAQRYFLF